MENIVFCYPRPSRMKSEFCIEIMALIITTHVDGGVPVILNRYPMNNNFLLRVYISQKRWNLCQFNTKETLIRDSKSIVYNVYSENISALAKISVYNYYIVKAKL